MCEIAQDFSFACDGEWQRDKTIFDTLLSKYDWLSSCRLSAINRFTYSPGSTSMNSKDLAGLSRSLPFSKHFRQFSIVAIEKSDPIKRSTVVDLIRDSRTPIDLGKLEISGEGHEDL
ncbi:hypothetical protein HN011_001166 [Eciton burchellii]|nr:hypothetical protein HN011_001166 [Eciton burchellii]